MTRLTPDERILVRLYQIAMENGDPLGPINLRSHSLGQKEVAMRNIIKLLAQANLVGKIDDDTLCLTQRGCDLAIDLYRK